MKKLLFILLIFFTSFSFSQVNAIEFVVGCKSSFAVSCSKDTNTDLHISIDDVVLLDVEISGFELLIKSQGLKFRNMKSGSYNKDEIKLKEGCVLEILFPETQNLFYLELFFEQDNWIIINPSTEELKKL